MDMFDRSSDESSDDEWFKQLVGSDKREPKEEVRVVEDEATQGEIIDNMLDTMVDQLIEFEEAFEYVLDELLEKVVKRGEIQVRRHGRSCLLRRVTHNSVLWGLGL